MTRDVLGGNLQLEVLAYQRFSISTQALPVSVLHLDSADSACLEARRMWNTKHQVTSFIHLSLSVSMRFR